MRDATSVRGLAKVLKAALRSRSRRALVPFLEGIYHQYDGWRSERRALATSQKIADKYELPLRSDSHAVRILIDACRKQARTHIDERSLSEWTMCIRKAWRRRERWQTFSSFLKDNGGISGVAALRPNLPRYRRSDF
jgi:CelD/BcsL family acetyltransferase involved in cellulose biosynthesis